MDLTHLPESPTALLNQWNDELTPLRVVFYDNDIRAVLGPAFVIGISTDQLRIASATALFELPLNDVRYRFTNDPDGFTGVSVDTDEIKETFVQCLHIDLPNNVSCFIAEIWRAPQETNAVV